MEHRNQERRSVVASGKTVDVAIENGLKMLGLLRDQVDVEVLSEGSRGVLGFGAEDARIRLVVKAPPEPAPVVAAPEPPLPPLREPSPPPLEVEGTRVTPESEDEGDRAAGQALEPAESGPLAAGDAILTELLKLMGIDASVEAYLSEELAEEGQPPPPVLNIKGEDLGILIGRRGETLRALQYLVRLMVSHRVKHWTNLVIDVESYRVRRRRTLENMASRVAEDVARTGRSRALEPMPAYDRRLVHIALRNHPDVATQSIGEGERRRVTVVPKR